MERNNPIGRRIDVNMLFVLFLLIATSLVAVYAAQLSDSSLGNIAVKQAMWFLVGAVMLVPMTLFDMEQYEKMAWVLYAIGLASLGFLMVAPASIVHIGNGAKSWYSFPGIGTFQPSELMKPFLIVCLARVIDRHHLNEPDNKTLKDDGLLVLKTGLITLVPIAFIMMQPDLGTSLVIIAIYFTMLIASRISGKILIPLFAGVAAFASAVIYIAVRYGEWLKKIGVDTYQLNRITSWLSGGQINNDQTYQLHQSLLAIGSGKVYGNGFSPGDAVYLPESHTDFIFSVITEHFGFIGGALVICLYFILIYHIIMTGIHSNQAFGSYLCTGVVGMLSFHVVENIGMVIGLLPITGIPLPFISYGGSSVLGSMMSIGLVMSVKYHTRYLMFS